jgi:hypothetical protein
MKKELKFIFIYIYIISLNKNVVNSFKIKLKKQCN